MKKVLLLVIDPQNSFCENVKDFEERQKVHNGELYVEGAEKDMERLSDFIKENKNKITDIHMTLDSHHKMHISHPIWFKNKKTGKHPNPFTIMKYCEKTEEIIGVTYTENESFVNGEYSSFNDSWTIYYLKELERKKRYAHCIWPYHCLIGTLGHNVYPAVFDAIAEWETDNQKICKKIFKGSDQLVEHFSAIGPEVDSLLNVNGDSKKEEILYKLNSYDEILISGEAKSHCVASTVLDIVKNDNVMFKNIGKKCVVLEDTTSNVGGFEILGEEFVKEAKSLGVVFTTTKNYG